MTARRLYIAGPMTGLPELNHPAFHTAAEQLRGAGYIVTNPAENGLSSDAPWIEHMRRDITLMMARSNAVATLPGFERSRGAGQVEIPLAHALGFEVMTVREWLYLAEGARALAAAREAGA